MDGGTALSSVAVEIRVRGRVQGVGFRPTVWRLASDLQLDGEVLNDSSGVLIRARGDASRIDTLLGSLQRDPPPLARIERIERRAFAGTLPAGFHIAASELGAPQTEISPDAALCAACAAEVLNPAERRHGYAFTNCTHCGPRLSIVRGVPYDRSRTSMARFALCPDCQAEYGNPADRRFHAEPIACLACGPQLQLLRLPECRSVHGDPVELAARIIAAGEIVALKGLGGYQLVCDATNAEAVARLRQRKRRDAKPFALMACDPAMIRRYCTLDPVEEHALRSPAAPIVLLRAANRLPAIAPGFETVGFMLPTTPLHLLLMRRLGRPAVMTSGNSSDEPQVIDDRELRSRLGGIADYALTHDREIANRIDDSVLRVMGGRPRSIRRARGYAPAPIRLPPGFEDAPPVLAMGGQLKATFALCRGGEAILSPHLGDLEHEAAFDAYRDTLALFGSMFDHAPAARVVDGHPEYASGKLGRHSSGEDGLPLIEVQHHHAHVASCLAENGRPLESGPVLGIVLDGLGWGDDGTIWGGEFLIADYRAFRRVGALRAVPMPGGAQAVREPWRNLYAHLVAAIGWDEVATAYPALTLTADLAAKPRAIIDVMMARGLNAPLSSSCGRLFDAVAAALGLCRDRQTYEGEAAALLEAAAARPADPGYEFRISVENGLTTLDPAPMWRALLEDLAGDTPVPVVAARFHAGLARSIVAMATTLAGPLEAVALSGGCMQNRLLFELLVAGLEEAGFSVLTQCEVPSNDGGLALGQAAIGAAWLLASPQEGVACA